MTDAFAKLKAKMRTWWVIDEKLPGDIRVTTVHSENVFAKDPCYSGTHPIQVTDLPADKVLKALELMSTMVRHDPGCKIYAVNIPTNCDCGFHIKIAKITRLLEPQPQSAGEGVNK